MPISQHILLDVGGTISLDITGSNPSTATVTIKTGTGSAIVSAESATISTVDTTLSSAASAGARTCAVASATGITSGTEFWVRTPDEKVRCKSISGTTVTLWRPLLYDHASGVTAEGGKVTYTISASNCDTLFWDGHAEWTLDSSLYDMTGVECTKYPLLRHATENDLFDEIPRTWVVDSDEDTEALLDDAFDYVLSRMAGYDRVRVRPASNTMIEATVFAAATKIFRRRPGDAAAELYERYRQELKEAIDQLSAHQPVDLDQDGVVEEAERPNYRSVKIVRS